MSTLFNAIKTYLVELLPTSTGIPNEVNTSITTFVGYVNGLNLILPISTLFTCLSIYIGFELTIMGIHLIKWIIRLVRGS